MPHVKEHLGEDAAIKLHKCPNENWFLKWTKLLNRVNIKLLSIQGFVLTILNMDSQEKCHHIQNFILKATQVKQKHQ